MINLCYACYVLLILVQARGVISSLPDEFMNGANLEFTTQDQQDPVSVKVPGDLTATFQGTTNLFDNSAVNLPNLQSSNLSPSDPFDSTPGRVNGGDKTALLFDESTGGGGEKDILIPSAPIQLIEGVPGLIDDIRRWFNNPKKPECKTNKHPICCQKGAFHLKNGRKRHGGRPPSVPPKVLFEPLEYSQRRSICRSCTDPPSPPPFLPLRFFCHPNPSLSLKALMILTTGLQSSLRGRGHRERR